MQYEALYRALKLRDQRIAQRLRFAAKVMADIHRDLNAEELTEPLTEAADDLERELGEQEAATLLHLGDQP